MKCPSCGGSGSSCDTNGGQDTCAVLHEGRGPDCEVCKGTGEVLETTPTQTTGTQTTPIQITPNQVGPNPVEEFETGPPGEEWLGWNGQKLARFTIFVWVGFKGEGTLLDLDGVKWLPKECQGKFDLWKHWDSPDLYDNGFSKHQIPKEPGLYHMDVTYWTTGGEDADFNHHVNKCSKVELLPTDHPDSVCPRCGKNADLQSCGERKEDGTDIETGYACGMCHARAELAAGDLAKRIGEAARGYLLRATHQLDPTAPDRDEGKLNEAFDELHKVLKELDQFEADRKKHPGAK